MNMPAEREIIQIHCAISKGTTWNSEATDGINNTMSINPTTNNIAPKRYLFEKRFLSPKCFPLLMLKIIVICLKARVAKVIVLAHSIDVFIPM